MRFTTFNHGYSYAIAVRVLLLIEFVANLKLGYSLIMVTVTL